MSRQLRAGFNTRPNEDGNAPIIDALNSDRTGSALSARQGRILNETVQALSTAVDGLLDSGLIGIFVGPDPPDDQTILWLQTDA